MNTLHPIIYFYLHIYLYLNITIIDKSMTSLIKITLDEVNKQTNIIKNLVFSATMWMNDCRLQLSVTWPQSLDSHWTAIGQPLDSHWTSCPQHLSALAASCMTTVTGTITSTAGHWFPAGALTFSALSHLLLEGSVTLKVVKCYTIST